VGKPVLQACLNSIINGSAWPAKLIVVDQGKNPDVANWVKYIQSLGIGAKHVISRQKGAAAARNRGIEIIQTKYVAALDDDCIISEDWLHLIKKKLAKNSEAIITGRVEPGKSVGALSIITSPHSTTYKQPVLKEDILFTGNMGCAKDIFNRVGLFDEALYTAEDNEWAYRALRAGIMIIYAPEIVVEHLHWRNDEQIDYRHKLYARGQGAFYGKYLRKGDVFIALRSLVTILRGCRRLVKGVMTSDREMIVSGRASIIDLVIGIINGMRYRKC
jgi:GT2 family glycosyltransferase